MRKKGMLLFITVVLLVSIGIVEAQTEGCCVAAGYGDICGLQTTEESCCPGGCPVGAFYPDSECSKITECIEYSKGCCKDICQDATFAAECPDKTKFVPDKFCSETVECARGCCRCIDVTKNTCEVSFNLVTQTTCDNDCSARGLNALAVDTSVTDVAQCSALCGAAIQDTYKLSGTVRDNLGQAVVDVSVVIAGIGTDVTDQAGYYEITNIPSGTYNVQLSKSGYGSLFQQTAVSADTTKDFVINKAANGRIFGVVTSNNIPLANVGVVLSGTYSSYVKTNSAGEYDISDIPFGTYTVKGTKTGYKDTTSGQVVLSSSNVEEQVDLELEQKISGQIVAKVNLQSATVTVAETGQSCVTNNQGTCTILDVPEGTYNVNSQKQFYSTQTKQVVIQPYASKEVVFNLVLRTDICNIDGETVLAGSCSLSSLPKFCENDLTVTQNKCFGADNVVGTNDDCGCLSGFKCQSTGFCVAVTEQCDSDCTFLKDSICHQECDGLEGCKFDDSYLMESCNGKYLGEVAKIFSGPDSGQDVLCCTGKPFTSQTEVCTTDADEDGDQTEDGNKCQDPDCLGDMCESGRICRDNFFGLPQCLPGLCIVGEVNQLCSCNGPTATPGEFCCPVDGVVYGTQSEFDSSVCGLTSCAAAGGECCLGDTCTNGKIFSLQLAAGNSCDVSDKNTICCPKTECLSRPNFCCDHEFQCSSLFAGANLCQDNGQVGCNVRCTEIKECVENTKINTIHNADKCKCQNQEIDKADYPTESCCFNPDVGSSYISNLPCGQKAPTGVIDGFAIDKKSRKPISFALVFVDNIFVASTDSIGAFTGEIPEGSHTAFATKLPLYDDSETVTFEILASQTINWVFELEPIFNPCDNASLSVKKFELSHVPGDVKKIQLKWDGPDCTNIVGYSIMRDSEELEFQSFDKTSMIDTAENYNTEYTYEIRVVYGPGQESEPVEAVITTGDAECDGTYVGGEFVEFCVSPDYRIGKGCNEENKAETVIDCEVNDLYCAGPKANGAVTCKDPSACSIFKQGAFPFGLYYDHDVCVGGGDNFCYFDHSSTTVDSCYQCEPGMTCFDYQSEGACLEDNCVAADGTECAWTDSYYDEYGKGYCYTKNYSKRDKCGLCSDDNDFFFNVRCTQDICSKLGDCFSDKNEENCRSCNQATCDVFKNQQQCIGNHEVQILSDLTLVGSDDICGLGVCKWDGDDCFKDGNDNDKPDCDIESNGGDLPDNEKFYVSECYKDNQAPITTVVLPDDFRFVGADDITLVLSTDLEKQPFNNLVSGGRYLVYCIDQGNICTPNVIERYDTEENQVQVDPKQYIEEQGIYYLRFYSIDRFFNQEELNSVSFYGDIVPPEIDISYTVQENVSGEPPDVESKVLFNISVNEKAECSDELVYLMEGSTQSVLAAAEAVDFYTTAYDVKDGVYQYVVSCTDLSGNVKSENFDVIVDAYKNIKIISPNNVYKDSKVMFDVETTDKSSCVLLDAGSPVSPMVSVDNTKHTVSLNLPEISRNYVTYTVECTDITNNIKDIANFVFTLDFTAPETKIFLDAEDNSVAPDVTLEDDNFGAFFNSVTSVEIMCEDPLIDDSDLVFGVDESTKLVCTTTSVNERCVPNKEVGLLGPVNDSLRMCYTCSDKGGNSAGVKCGNIVIDKSDPTFAVFVGGDEIISSFTRTKPTTFYDVMVEASEQLLEAPKLRMSVLGTVYPREIPLKQVSDTNYMGKMFIPYNEPLFDDIEGENNAEFVVTGIDKFGNLGEEIKLGRYFSIDTKVPAKPILNRFPPTQAVKYVNDGNYYQTGFDGDFAAERSITIESSNKFEIDNQGEIVLEDGDSDNYLTTEDPVRTLTTKLYSVRSAKEVLVDKHDLDIVAGNYIEFASVQDPDRIFYKITGVGSEIVSGDEKVVLTLERDLFFGSGEYTGGIDVKVYENEYPVGWFESFTSLSMGSNYFNAYAVDESGNMGEKTETKKVVYDVEVPELVSVYPGDKSMISNGRNGIPIAAVVRDLNSGINGISAKLQIGDAVYRCTDLGVECTGDKDFMISFMPGMLSEGENLVMLDVDDKAGNYGRFSWSFEIDNGVPSMPVLMRNYFDTHSPEITFMFEPGDKIQVDQVFVDGASVNFQQVNDYTFTANAAGLSESEHMLRVLSKNELAPGVFSDPGTAYLQFFVDLTDPEVIVDASLPTNKGAVVLSGNYLEDNVDSIVFWGDLKENVTLESGDLPYDVADGKNLFLADLELDVSEESSNHSVHVTIVDKAGNSKTVDTAVQYYRVGPVFREFNILVDGDKKLIQENITHFKTNDIELVFTGKLNKQLSSLVIESSGGQFIEPVFNDNAPFDFTAVTNIEVSKPAIELYEEFNVVAVDLAGNVERYTVYVELDVRKPKATILWV